MKRFLRTRPFRNPAGGGPGHGGSAAAAALVLSLAGIGLATPAAAQQAEAGFGRASFVVEPPDARIGVGGRVLRAANAPTGDRPPDLAGAPGAGQAPGGSEPPATASLPAGDYVAEVTRPGYLPTLVGFTVVRSRDVTVTVALERASATLRLRTAPSDATVLIDGFVRGHTEGPAEPGFAPPGSAARVPRTSFSRRLWLADLSYGKHRIEVRKEGFRTFDQTLDVGALLDYELPPVVLQSENAVLLLDGLPEDAKVFANGREIRPDRTKLKPEAFVRAGQVDLVMTRGVQDYFETSLVVEDGAWVDVAVEMKPALAFLGTFGEDAAGLRAVASTIEFLRDEGVHIVLDRSQRGRAVFAERGIDAAALRDWTTAKSELDWNAIQEQIQEETPAALYFAAVLSDDLAADSVDLWWWSAKPGPARPDVLTLDLRSGRFEGSALRRLARSLNPALDVGSRTPDLGLGLIESLKSDALVVATVDPGGPAAVAGVLPGMEIWRIAGKRASAEELTAAMNRLRPGGAIELAVGGEAEEATAMVVSPAWGWAQLDVFGQDLLLSAAASRLIRELDRTTETPRWLVELDLAALALAAGDAETAARLLVAIDAPERAGLGAGTVQYALGVALTDLADRGQRGELRRALNVFESLASTGRGRLTADEGPEAAPRARLRAGALADRRK